MNGTSARAIWNSGTKTKSKGKYWHGHDKSQEWQGQSRHNDWSTPVQKGENSGAVSTAVVKLQTATGGRSQMVQLNMVNESSVQCHGCEMHQETNHDEGLVRGRFKNVQRMHHQDMCVNEDNKYQAPSMLETVREEDDETEQPINVFDKSHLQVGQRGRCCRQLCC